MSLGRQAAQGALWNYSAFLVSKGLLFVATLVLARLLTPAQFGLVSMALLIITLLDILRDFGIGSALIYRQRDGAAVANMAFFLSAGIGVVLFVANLLLAPLAASFFKTSSPEETSTLVALLQVLGASLLFSSLGSAHDALLQREINYRRRMVPEVGRTLIKGVLSVVLALMGFGAWSLVIGQVIGEASATVLLWVVMPWRPSRNFDRGLLRPLVTYGTQIMVAGGLGTLLSDVDYFIVGSLLGDAPLGLYTLAFRIPELLIKNLAQAVSTVAFPVAARLQADREAMRDAYLMMQRYMLVILAPLGFGLYAVTPPLVHFLFSPSWEPGNPGDANPHHLYGAWRHQPLARSGLQSGGAARYAQLPQLDQAGDAGARPMVGGGQLRHHRRCLGSAYRARNWRANRYVGRVEIHKGQRPAQPPRHLASIASIRPHGGGRTGPSHFRPQPLKPHHSGSRHPVRYFTLRFPYLAP